MVSKIPEVVIIPDSNSKKLYGIDPVIITREDMVSITGWYKLAVGHDMFLNEREFKNRDMFTKYWMILIPIQPSQQIKITIQILRFPKPVRQ